MDSVLSIGQKHGCLTIIGDDFEAYQEEVEKQKLINGERSIEHNIKSVDDSDMWIQWFKSNNKYICQCKCGKVRYINGTILLRKKMRYCGDDCAIKQEHIKKRLASYPRVKDKSYDIDYSNTIHESLEILECIDDGYEEQPIIFDKRKKDGGIFKVFKLYKCRCYLCGKEYQFKSSDFEIKKDTYGYRAKDGYYCDAFCDCHNISSFQWRTIKILREYYVAYRVEFEFQDLYGAGHKKLLRYDFAVLGSDNTSIKYLIECQGEQHYKPVVEFGGFSQYQSQVKNDELKRVYAKSHNISLVEIPYTCNTYDKEIEFLKTARII